MHYCLEIIMPQVDDIEKAVHQILKPFDENSSYEEDEEFSGHPFYDWYVIGGRWAGHKLTDCLDKDKLSAFYAELTEKKITVSGVQCGKQEISPASQIPIVDELWANYFPEYKGRACPMFNHSNNQYANNCLYGDALRLKDTDKNITMGRVIFAAENYEKTGLEAKEMYSTSVWNGVTHEATTWDGSLKSALKMHNKSTKNYRDDYRESITPTEDWLIVTVDYHS